MIDFLTILSSFGFFWVLRRVFSTLEARKEDKSYTKPIEMSDMGVGSGQPLYTPNGPYMVKIHKLDYFV